MTSSRCILLVDDSPNDHFLADEAVRHGKMDFKLCHANSGKDCLEHLRAANKHPDVVLLDLRMPDMDGFQVLMELAGDPTLQDIPVLILSSSGNPEDVRLAYELGCKSYIMKPIDFNQFIQVLTTLSAYWLKTVMLPQHLRR